MNKNIEYCNLNNLNNNKIKILNNYKISIIIIIECGKITKK